jgi:hypothetical protein
VLKEEDLAVYCGVSGQRKMQQVSTRSQNTKSRMKLTVGGRSVTFR